MSEYKQVKGAIRGLRVPRLLLSLVLVGLTLFTSEFGWDLVLFCAIWPIAKSIKIWNYLKGGCVGPDKIAYTFGPYNTACHIGPHDFSRSTWLKYAAKPSDAG